MRIFNPKLTLPLIIFGFALAMRLYGLSAAGNSWDEHFYYDAAQKFAQNIRAGDFRSESWIINQEHPPLGKYLYIPAVALNSILDPPNDRAYATARILSAIYSVLTVLLVYQIGRHFFSKSMGFLAAVILALIPSYLAYSKTIVLDMPLVLFFTAATYFFLKAIEENKPQNYTWAVIFAAAAFTTKFNGGLILILFIAIFLLYNLKQVKTEKSVTIPILLLFSPLIFFLVLILIWPWLWNDTFDHLLKSFMHWGGRIEEEFLGKEREGPIYYFLLYFLVTTPALLFIPFLTWICQTLKNRQNLHLSILFWFLVPFLISFFHLRQDGIRYILPSYPAFALGTALGLQNMSLKLQNFGRFFLPFLVFLYLGTTLVFSYPYFLDYYNEPVGFTKNIERKHLFVVGFYGQGMEEALNYLAQNAPEKSKVKIIITPDRDVIFYQKKNDKIILKDKLVRTFQDDYDYLILYRTSSKEEREKIDFEKLKVIYQVKAMGAPLATIYQRIE